MEDQFWYPQLEGDDSNSKVVTSALNQFISLFDGEPDNFETPPLSSAGSKDLFNLDSLLKKLEEGIEDDLILVVGTCSEEQAIEHSWEQLGLNLFDLPWFASEKAFQYVNATALFEDVGALELLLDQQGVNEELLDVEGVNTNLEKAKEQLECAQCHRFAQAVQDFVGHGERDDFQWKDVEKIVDELGKRYDAWKEAENLRQKHIDEDCDACELLDERIEHLREERSDEEYRDEEVKRDIADLDSHIYKLALVLHFDQGESGDEKNEVREEPRFRCVVLLEDDPTVRRELRKELREVLLPADDGSNCDGETTKWCTSDSFPITEDSPLSRHLYERGGNLLYVLEADKELSTKRHRLVDEGGDEILNGLLDSGIPIVRKARSIVRKARQKPEEVSVHHRPVGKSENGDDENEDGEESEGSQEGNGEAEDTNGENQKDKEKARDANRDNWSEADEDELQNLAKQEATLQPSEILTCFDLDLKTDTGELSDTLHRGLWVMYGTACSYPQIPRMVVTGYRSQTAMGHGAGAHAYLMKPFTTEKLGEAIKKAQNVHQVVWVCPGDVQDDYKQLDSDLCIESINGESNSSPIGEEDSSDDEDSSDSEGDSARHFFDSMEKLLQDCLRKKRISLMPLVDSFEEAEAGKFAGSDLVILDPFKIKDLNAESHAQCHQMIKEVRSVNPDVPILLLLPTDSDSLLLSMGGDEENAANDDERKWRPEEVVEKYLRGSPLRLQEGKDRIARKPFWISADGHSNPEAGLANQIHSLLSAQEEFDVKYQVLVPAAAILGRCGERIHSIESRMYEEISNLDEVFAPFLPFLAQAYGLSASLHDLKAIESARLASDLRLQIRRDQKQNDWVETGTETVKNVLYYFAENAISSAVIQRHVTVENWMRRMVDREARKVYAEEVIGPDAGERDQSGFEDISPLVRPLTRLFGGSTRYEFSARGSWYDEKNRRVDDILIVVEFSARSSIVARHVVEDLAVHYLSKVAGEDEVMVQEIAADAHFWSDS